MSVNLTLNNVKKIFPTYEHGQEITLKYLQKIKRIHVYFQKKFDKSINTAGQPQVFYNALLEYKCAFNFFIRDIIVQFKFHKISEQVILDDYYYCKECWTLLNNVLRMMNNDHEFT